MTINDSMSNTADTASQKSSPARDRLNKIADNVADSASNMREKAADWVSEHGDQLSDTQKRLVDNTTRYVSANPMKSIGIAVVAALLVGRLLK